MDQHKPPLAGERVGGLAGGGEAVALQHDLGAERLGAVDLDEGRALGHHDRRRDAEPAGVIGDALGVVAGRHRDDAGARSGRSSVSSLLSAPRSLNEPVRCSVSSFR